MLERLLSIPQWITALVVLAVGLAIGGVSTAYFKNGEIARIDAQRVAAVQELSKLEQAQTDARVESARMATRWTENINANKVKSDAMVAALAVDRARLAVRVRELSEIIAQVRRDPISAAAIPAGAANSDAAGAGTIDGAAPGPSLEDYGAECEQLRIGLIDARHYLVTIGAMKPY